jgi:hypothetical protein
MREPNIIEGLPDGFEIESGAHGILALAREFAPALRGAGYGLDSDGAWAASALSGRKPLRDLPTSAGVFLVRRFSHGGLLRFLTRERFRDPSRPFRELAVSCTLSRAGVSTPQVVAARARPAPGWGWRLEIMTRRVEGALDLDEVLAWAREGRIDRRCVARISSAIGRLVCAMHDVGCAHADLTTKNMLVERSSLSDRQPKTWILDLDRANLVFGLTDKERLENLSRLYRYVLRREQTKGAVLSRTDWVRFLASYEVDRVPRKALARAILRSHSRSIAWHALGWRLERLFSPR